LWMGSLIQQYTSKHCTPWSEDAESIQVGISTN
jgi:hypothetical protein